MQYYVLVESAQLWIRKETPCDSAHVSHGFGTRAFQWAHRILYTESVGKTRGAASRGARDWQPT
jgi:hypothetical protein